MDEFSLIQRYFLSPASRAGRQNVVLGIGDDTAILKVAEGEELLVTTDTLISGVHFPENTDPAAIGHKALAVNLSDIAAMGGDARWFTLALSLPEVDDKWLQAFSQGLLDLAKRFAVSLVGGDTTRGALSITLSAMGTSPDSSAVRRSGARPGDRVYMTGRPGLAALGLAFLNADILLAEKEQTLFIGKLNLPEPRLPEGQKLRDYVTAMIDTSDGLAADLGHILDASGCSAELDAEKLMTYSPASSSVTDRQYLDAVLYGGDDYELLFTLSPEKACVLEQDWPASYASITHIGEIHKGEGIFLQQANGKHKKIMASGYNHFNE